MSSLPPLVTGKTLGGLTLTPVRHRLDRETALRLYTEGSAWFSTETGKKGALIAGQYADLAILDGKDGLWRHTVKSDVHLAQSTTITKVALTTPLRTSYCRRWL